MWSQLLLIQPAHLTAAIIVITITLFVTDFFSLDLTAALVMATLMALGLITPEQGVAGFSNVATVTVASVLVLSAGLQKTGAIDIVGYKIIEVSGGSPRRYLVIMMSSVGLLSAFINNTAAVAIFLPIVLSSSKTLKINPSKLLIPLSFASQFGGVSTLIGTSTNLLVSSIAASEGVGAFSMFEFTPLGSIMFAIGIIYFVLIGQRLIPERLSDADLEDEVRSQIYMTEIRIPAGSQLIGRRVDAIPIIQHERLRASRVIRGQKGIPAEECDCLLEGDAVLVEGPLEELAKLKGEKDFDLAPDIIESEGGPEAEAESDDLVRFVEVLVPSGSILIGKTLRMVKFEQRYQARVIAIRRHGKSLGTKLDHVRLMVGDILVLQGHDEALKDLAGERDFALITSTKVPVLRRRRLALSLVIMLGVIGLATVGTLPITVTAVGGAILMVVTGILDLEEAYASIDSGVIMILASSIALATAMENSGLALMIAEGAMSFVYDMGPVALVSVFYILTSLMTEVLSNNASAVMMSRIAIAMAEAMGVDPKPLLMSITYSASDSFLTPKGYQTNTMVYGPGGYRFTDYLMVGAPLVLMFWAACSFLIPLFWPL